MLSVRWVYNTVYGFKMLQNSIFHLNIDKKVMVEKITNSTNNFCWKSKTSITGHQYTGPPVYTGPVDQYNTGTGASLLVA